MTRTFGKAAAKASVDRDTANFTIVPIVDSVKADGTEVTFDLKAFEPTEPQLAVLMASIARSQKFQTSIAGAINFFVSILDDDSAGYIERRLLDGADAFGLEDLQEIIEFLVEEWSGNPTGGSSAST